MKYFIIYFLLFSILTESLCFVRYDNYQLFKIFSKTKQHLKILQKHEFQELVTFWKTCHHVPDICDVMVQPQNLKIFKKFMAANRIHYELSLSNIQRVIDETRPNLKLKTGMEWSNYHNLTDIYEFLDKIEINFPQQVKGFELPGKSYEGREIRGVKISYRSGNKAIFIESNMHAREWISSATATWLINELLNSKNESVRYIAENFDWYIIPVLNPDGFVHTYKENRMWRKTRKPYKDCFGADPNRNFDFLWMTVGASDDPCSDTYAGPKPNSEPEVQALVNLFDNIPKNYIKIYISLHSYSQMALTPWGHTNQEFPKNYNDMLKVGKGFADAAAVKFGTVYQYGASSVVLYNVSGSSKEWAYGVQNIPFTFTLELRDTGKYGFLLPPQYIIPNAQEVMDGLIGMIAAMPRYYL